MDKELKDAMEQVVKTTAETGDKVSKNMDSFTLKITELEQKNAALTESLNVTKTELEAKIKEVGLANTSTKAVSLPGVDEGKKKFSWAKAFFAIGQKDWKDAGFEKEVFDETLKKAETMAMSPATSGGYLLPVQIAAEIIELLRPAMTLEALGVRVLPNLKGQLQITKQTGGAVGYWVSEGKDSITKSDLTFGQINLHPKTCGALMIVTQQLLRNATPDVELMIKQDFAYCLAQKIFYAALLGSGASGEPIGILNTTGINTHAIGVNGGMWDYIAADKMAGELEDDNALRGNLNYVMNPAVKRKLKQKTIAQFAGDLGGMPLMLPMSDAKLAENLGYGVYSHTDIPKNLTKVGGTNLSYVFFGNWSELILGYWSGMILAASDSAGTDTFERNLMKIKATIDADIAVRHPQSFCVCSDAETV